MTDLEIKYNNGSMVVHLEEFLDCRNISNARKLIRLIQRSYTPDGLDKLKEFVEQQTEQFEPRMKEDVRFVVEYKSKLKFSQEPLDGNISNRSRFKRNSEGWQKYNELAKQQRQEISAIKTQIRNKNSDFNSCMRNKAFCEKVLETIL